ncbi:MAG: hypothetical protein ACHREM_01225 [Polyangiales bacterium]
MSASPNVRIAFPRPGWFLTDTRVVVRFNDSVIYDGSFRSGFEHSTQLPPGRHTLTTTIDVGLFNRTRSYELDVPTTGLCEVTLSYSRFWGNFTKRLVVSTASG